MQYMPPTWICILLSLTSSLQKCHSSLLFVSCFFWGFKDSGWLLCKSAGEKVWKFNQVHHIKLLLSWNVVFVLVCLLWDQGCFFFVVLTSRLCTITAVQATPPSRAWALLIGFCTWLCHTHFWQVVPSNCCFFINSACIDLKLKLWTPVYVILALAVLFQCYFFRVVSTVNFCSWSMSLNKLRLCMHLPICVF